MAGSEMTNEQITAEFEELFGGGNEPDEEEAAEEEETTTEEDSEESTEDTSEETEEDGEDDSEESEDEEDESEDESETASASKPSKQAKQNHAFAEQRLQIKQNEQFIRDIGKLIGFDSSASLSDIQDKVKEVLLEKEAKDNNIPVDIMKRLDRAEALIQENDRIKLEKKVTEDFSELIDKHNLSEEDVQEFTAYLIDNGKNPMLDPGVDIASEYLKLHYEDMVKKAVDAALAKEEARQKKVEEKAASATSKSAADKEETKISSVKDLDDVFAKVDL